MAELPWLVVGAEGLAAALWCHDCAPTQSSWEAWFCSTSAATASDCQGGRAPQDMEHSSGEKQVSTLVTGKHPSTGTCIICVGGHCLRGAQILVLESWFFGSFFRFFSFFPEQMPAALLGICWFCSWPVNALFCLEGFLLFLSILIGLLKNIASTHKIYLS